jgi:hypothetical protein
MTGLWSDTLTTKLKIKIVAANLAQIGFLTVLAIELFNALFYGRVIVRLSPIEWYMFSTHPFIFSIIVFAFILSGLLVASTFYLNFKTLIGARPNKYITQRNGSWKKFWRLHLIIYGTFAALILIFIIVKVIVIKLYY